MSAPIQHEESDARSMYVPKWARDAAGTEPANEPALPLEQLRKTAEGTSLPERKRPPWLTPLDPPFEGDVMMKQLRLRQSLDPAVIPDPPFHFRRRAHVGFIGRFTGAVTIAAVAAFLIIELIPPPKMQGATKGDRNLSVDSTSRSPDSVRNLLPDASTKPIPRLAVENRRGLINEPIPLKVALAGAGSEVFLLITGIAGGTRLSAGTPVGANGWLLRAEEVGNVLVVPPPNFSGTMEARIDLRLEDDTVVDSRELRLEWFKAAASADPLNVPVTSVAPSVQAQSIALPSAGMRRLDPEEIMILTKRGEDLIAQGDITSARLMLRRAVEAGDARAALALGATYDPNVLRKLGVIGLEPDLAQARAWYGKAMEFGSAEASRRLEQLAQQTR